MLYTVGRMALLRLQILTALLSERRAIARAFGWPDNMLEGQIGGCAVELKVIGIRGRQWDGRLASNQQAVLLAGLGGALSPDLRVGELVLDGADWGEKLIHRPAMTLGPIACAAGIVATPAAKTALFASSGALAVDMESDAVRAATSAPGIPLLHLRAISDAADESLDPALLGLIDPVGRPKPTAVAAYMLRDPRRLGSLLRLGKASSFALGRLGLGVRALLEGPELLHALSDPAAA